MLAVGKGSGVSREPISVFCQIKKAKGEKRKELEELLSKLKKEFPGNYKIGAAVGAGDCFFDSVAQGLNELKSNGLITSSEEFNVKSLRKSCKQYAKQSKSSSWLNKALKKEDAVCGRNEIEGKIICEKYNVKIKVIELHEKSVDGLHITTDEVGTGDNVVYIVNYSNHFVPLLSNIEKDIEDDMPVSREKIYGVSSNTSEKPKAEKKDLNEILARCEELICDKCDKGEDIFELLDPLISDTQCHIHSVLIHSILSRCYAYEDKTFHFNNVGDKEKELLSYAVLFSLLKLEERDKLGFATYEIAIESFNILPDTEAKESKAKKCFDGAREEFNLHSIKYLKDSANGKIKEVLDKCEVKLVHSKAELQLLPCYASVHTVIKYLEEKKLPIVISLIRINREVDDQLSINSTDVLFYQFQEGKKMFCYEENFSEEKKVQPTITFLCFSMIGKSCPDKYKEYADGTQVPSKKFLTEDCDIRDFLMVHPAGHIQLSKMAKSSSGEPINEKYVENLYKQNSDESIQPQSSFKGNYHLIDKNIFGCFQKHLELAKEFDIVGARYSQQKSSTGKALVLERRNEDTFFAIDHIYLSSYSREHERLSKLDGKVNIAETVNPDKEGVISKVREKLRLAGPNAKVDGIEVLKFQENTQSMQSSSTTP